MIFAAVREDLAIHSRRVPAGGVRFLLALHVGARLRLLARGHRERRELALEIVARTRRADGRMSGAHEGLEDMPAGSAAEVEERHGPLAYRARPLRTVLSFEHAFLTNLAQSRVKSHDGTALVDGLRAGLDLALWGSNGTDR